MKAEEVIKALQTLGDLDNTEAARVQIDTLMREALEADAANPGQTFRMTVDGPEQTLAEILAEFEKDEDELRAIRAALKGQP